MTKVLSYTPYAATAVVALGLVFVAAIGLIPQSDFLPLGKSKTYVVIGERQSGLELPSAAQLGEKLKSFEVKKLFCEKYKNGIQCNGEFTVTEKQVLVELKASYPGFKWYVNPENPTSPNRYYDQDLNFYTSKESMSTWQELLQTVDGIEGYSSSFNKKNRAFINNSESSLKREFEKEVLIKKGQFLLESDSELALDPNYGLVNIKMLNNYKSFNNDIETRYLKDNSIYGRIDLSIVGRTPSDVKHELTKLASQNQLTLNWDMNEVGIQNQISWLYFSFFLSVMVSFLILYIYLRSMRLTFIILATLLWGITGAVPGLLIHSESFNASVILGLILLAGTVVNNGILLLDSITKNRREQMSQVKSSIEAIKKRFIPIAVTSITTILGMIPMVLFEGEGSQFYRGLAISVVYGALFSVPFSIISVPCMLVFFDYIAEKIWKFILKARLVLCFG